MGGGEVGGGGGGGERERRECVYITSRPFSFGAGSQQQPNTHNHRVTYKLCKLLHGTNNPYDAWVYIHANRKLTNEAFLRGLLVTPSNFTPRFNGYRGALG